MVTITSADNALKSLYLEVVSDQLNTAVNPLMTKFKSTETCVYGKEIIKLAPYGVNGGVGAGTETDELPRPAQNNYKQFKLSLKNLYGTIEISDKAIRASANSAGAFVNLLNAEMEGLLTASKFNFGRMLYGDGSGKLATIASATASDLTLDSVQNIIEGMVVDICDAGGTPVEGYATRRILTIDRKTKKITVTGTLKAVDVANCIITLQGSYGKELTGLGAIFSNSSTLYGLSRSENLWLTPQTSTSATITDSVIQSAIDRLEEVAGSCADFIVCSYGVKRAYQNYLRSASSNVDIMNLEGGYRALSYNGIPLIADRFVPAGTMYILNSKEFNLHQLCDWRWLEGEDGRVLRQVAGKPVYTATLVKYADLICNKPGGQAKISGITES